MKTRRYGTVWKYPTLPYPRFLKLINTLPCITLVYPYRAGTGRVWIQQDKSIPSHTSSRWFLKGCYIHTTTVQKILISRITEAVVTLGITISGSKLTYISFTTLRIQYFRDGNKYANLWPNCELIVIKYAYQIPSNYVNIS